MIVMAEGPGFDKATVPADWYTFIYHEKSSKRCQPGLDVSVFYDLDEPTELPDFRYIIPDDVYHVEDIDFYGGTKYTEPTNLPDFIVDEENYGLFYNGWFYAAEAGEYTL